MLSLYIPMKGIYYALSETLYGPYGTPKVLLPIDHHDLTCRMPPDSNSNCLYGGFTHEVMHREQGRIVPFVISQWYRWPGQPRYYGSRLFEAEFE